MPSSLDAALSGMLEHERKMELIANNLANINTTGYKRVVVHFQDVLDTAGIVNALNGELPPAEVTTSSGVETEKVERAFAQGSLLASPEPLDMAIMGAGLFRVLLEDGTVAYTRDGTFRVDAERRLVTQLGSPMEPPLTIPSGVIAVHVGRQGQVTVRRPLTPDEVAALAPGEPADGIDEEVGRIALTRFDNPDALASIGGNLFVEDGDAGAVEGFPGEGSMGEIAGGFLESSNVDLGEEMTSLIAASRAYQINLAAYRAIEEMLAQANELV